MVRKEFSPGFRIDIIDCCVLAAGGVGAYFLAQVEVWFGLAVGFVVGHFFLFCNIIRMARLLELIWTAVFIMLIATTVTSGQPGWLVAVLVSLTTTVLVVVIQLRSPAYHGLGWQRINPGLRHWWEACVDKSGSRPA